jgi:hypothetical protein
MTVLMDLCFPLLNLSSQCLCHSKHGAAVEVSVVTKKFWLVEL